MQPRKRVEKREELYRAFIAGNDGVVRDLVARQRIDLKSTTSAEQILHRLALIDGRVVPSLNIPAILNTLAYLIEQPAFNVDVVDAGGNNAAHLFCRHAWVFPVELILGVLTYLTRRMDFSQTNHAGMLPVCVYLQDAYGVPKHLQQVNLSLLEFLLQHTPDVNVPNATSETFIMHVIKILQKHAAHDELIMPFLQLILRFKPDINRVNKEGLHVLDLFSPGNPQYELLLEHGAMPVATAQIEELKAEIQELKVRAATLIQQLQTESQVYFDSNKTLAVEEELRASADYVLLTTEVVEKMNRMQIIAECPVNNLAELETVYAKYPRADYYVFVNTQTLAFGRTTTAFVCTKLDLGELYTALHQGLLQKRALGWNLLMRRWQQDVLSGSKSMMHVGSRELHFFNCTESCPAMIVHATNPAMLAQNLVPATSCFNHMLYFSGSLVAENMTHFKLTHHPEAPFFVYLILDVDPRAICLYSHCNANTPFVRSNDTFTEMLAYFRHVMQQYMAHSFVFNVLQHGQCVPVTSYTPNMFARAGITQIQATTRADEHNEVLVMGNQIASAVGANPTRVIGVAIDQTELLMAANHPTTSDILQTIQDSGLPLLLVNFNRLTRRFNPQAPLIERLQITVADAIREREQLLSACHRAYRLGGTVGAEGGHTLQTPAQVLAPFEEEMRPTKKPK